MKDLRKWSFMIVFFALAVSAATAGVDKDKNEKAAQGIVFTSGSWASILKKARDEKKIIFFDAYTTWCGPCKLLQKNVFTRQDVGDLFNEKFINVKFDMESGEGPELAKKFPLEGYPTLFFIDPKGKVIEKVTGYRKAEDLIKIANSVKKSPAKV